MLAYAHNMNEQQAILREWILKDHTTLKATFLIVKADKVVLENTTHTLISFPIASFSTADQAFIRTKMVQIQQMNQPIVEQHNLTAKSTGIDVEKLSLVAFCLLMLLWLVVSFSGKFQVRSLAYLLILFGLSAFYSFVLKPYAPRVLFGSTNPLTIDSAFVAFKPNVYTRWDNQYFYVESKGIPTTHPMMAGITAWQQQVPIPQCYVGANAWSIPLNPVIAATPTPTRTNFFKGAVALAANGIPIFNALNNRGEDSYQIGELDQYGGHCGRADDYHYHIAPLSLDSINADILPIAFALDGFAVYAAKEPNGSAMTNLDTNHGHYLNGVYHYHGTTTYPYVIGNMVGVVTKDSTDQIMPQAQTKPIRPAGTPLNGAVITNHELTGTDAYKLTYTLNNQTYFVNYSWTNRAVYTFMWGSPTGTTSSNYIGQLCILSTGINDVLVDDTHVKIYPNPSKNGFSLDLSSPYNVNDIKAISVYDAQGRLMQKVDKYKSYIETPHYTEGVYFVKIQFGSSELTKRLVIQSK